MRDNGEAGGIIAGKDSSARQAREAVATCPTSRPSCPALCRASTSYFCARGLKTWMAGTSPAMTS